MCRRISVVTVGGLKALADCAVPFQGGLERANRMMTVLGTLFGWRNIPQEIRTQSPVTPQ